jgi:hypothetical protein
MPDPAGRTMPRWLTLPLLLAVAVLTAACSGAPGTAPPGGSNDLGHVSASPSPSSALYGLGAKWAWARADKFTPYLETMPGGPTFYEVVWCDVERARGRRDWSRVDDVARRTKDVGFTLYLKIRVGSCWATGGRGVHIRGKKQKTESAMPIDLGAYTSFVRDTVTRYSAYGVHEYAVENEVNAKTMWAGSPADLTRLVTLAASAIRAADPRALVVDPGISSPAYGVAIAQWLLDQGRGEAAVAAYQSYYERRFPSGGRQLPRVADVAGLRRVLVGESAQRDLAYLAAVRDLAQRRVVDVYQLHFYEKWTNVSTLLEYLRAHLPAGMPIEAWEVGMFQRGNDAGDRERAAEVAKVVAQLLVGGVRRVIWLPLAFDPDGGNSDEPRYGLLHPDGAVRPAGAVFGALAESTHGASVRAVQVGEAGGVGFERQGSTTLVLWSKRGVELETSSLPGLRAALVGEAPVAPKGGKVQVGDYPVLVTVDRGLGDVLRMLS